MFIINRSVFAVLAPLALLAAAVLVSNWPADAGAGQLEASNAESAPTAQVARLKSEHGNGG